MVNVKKSISTNFISAMLTGMIISFFSFALLTFPVWTIVRRFYSTLPIRIFFLRYFMGLRFVFTFIGTILTISKFYLAFMNRIRFSANNTVFSYKRFWFSQIGLWLNSSELTTTMIRTKLWLSVCPLFKLSITPLANKYRFFIRILGLIIAITTSGRAKFSIFAFASKWLITLWTNKRVNHFSTSSCYLGFMSWAVWPRGNTLCQWIANPFKPMNNYTIFLVLVQCLDKPVSRGKLAW